MELKMKKATKVLVAGACAAALMVGSAVPAVAATSNPVPVTYSTSQTVGGNANWAVEMPTAITFDANIGTPSSFDIKLINSDGGKITEVTTLNNGLAITMMSAGEMQLTEADVTPPATPEKLLYEIRYAGGASISVPLFDTTKPAATATEFAKLKATENEQTVTGTAMRKTSSLKGGTFKDTLTFGFDETTNDPAPTPPTS